MDWHIQSRSRSCHQTGKPFSDGEIYHTVLLENRAGFERLDVSDEAWKSGSEELLARPGVISHWKGSYEAPPPVPPDAIRKDDAESLLRKLMERGDAQYDAATYILAVMLERKRILRVKAQQKDGGRRVFIYEHPRSGDIFAIADPNLQLDQLEDVQRTVSELLERGLNDSSAPATPTPAEVAVEAATAEPAASEEQPSIPVEPSGSNAESPVESTQESTDTPVMPAGTAPG